MLEEMTPAQLEEWMQYAEIEPFGIDEADFRAAVLNGTVAGAFGAKVDPTVFTLRRFIEQLADGPDEAGGVTPEAFDRLAGVH